MTDDRMFTELPQDEQQMLIDEVKRLKITCEPKKLKVSELYALIDNAEKTSEEKHENADNAVAEIDNSTQDQKLENESEPVTNDAENADDVQAAVPETEIKPATPPKQPVKKSKKDQGLCISCYSKVYDGVCCGCGRRY